MKDEQYNKSLQKSISKKEKNKIYNRGIEKGIKRGLIRGLVIGMMSMSVVYFSWKKISDGANDAISQESYISGWEAVADNLHDTSNNMSTYIEPAGVASDIAFDLKLDSDEYHDIYTDLYGAYCKVSTIVSGEDKINNMNNIVRSCNALGIIEYKDFTSLCEAHNWIDEEGNIDTKAYVEDMKDYIKAQEKKQEAQKTIDNFQNPTDVKGKGVAK